MLKTIRRAEFAELMGMYFLQGAALGMWFVPLSTVLEAHGLATIRPYAFATSAVAAFVSPLFFGAVADRHASPVARRGWLRQERQHLCADCRGSGPRQDILG